MLKVKIFIPLVTIFLVRVDEWGAVIKNQSEAFKRMEEDKQRKRAEDMKSYGNDLDSHIFNRNK
jgi:hypothetical protein